MSLSSTPGGKWQLHSSDGSYQNLGVTLESTLWNLTCDLFAEFVDSTLNIQRLQSLLASPTGPSLVQTKQDHSLFPIQQLEGFLKGCFRSGTPAPSPYSGLQGTSPPALLPSLTSSISFSFAHSVPAKLAPRMPLNTPGAFPPQRPCTCCFLGQDAPPPHARKACCLISFISTSVQCFLRRCSLTILLKLNLLFSHLRNQ